MTFTINYGPVVCIQYYWSVVYKLACIVVNHKICSIFSSSRDVKPLMIEVGILVKIRTLFFLEDSLNQDCFTLLVKDGTCAVLLPSLRLPSMRFLLKGCGRYDSVIAQRDILIVVITIVIFNIERVVSCGLS